MDDYEILRPADYAVFARFFNWTTEPPTEPGWYWVCLNKWNEYGEKDGLDVHMAHIDLDNGKPINQYPMSGYEWENDFEASEVIRWLGPLPVPEKPE